LRSIFLYCLFLLLVQCRPEKTNESAISVFASIPPQKYFIDKIGGSHVEVSIMVEPGASPHSYEPRPSQMTALSKARAYFAIGLEFENAWLSKFERLSPGIRIVHVDSGVEKMQSSFDPDEKNKKLHSDHRHGGLDPHIWLSPELVKKQTEIIYEALRTIDPSNDSVYSLNFRTFLTRIERLQDTVRTLLASAAPSSSPNPASIRTKPSRSEFIDTVRSDPSDGVYKAFMVFHPSWRYFAREFNLRQIAVEIDGKEPGPRQLETIFDRAKTYGIRTIFVQPQFSQQSAQVIARQIHARIAIADDLAYDWETNLITMAKAIAQK
jgi:zinc transport system substrate-binding protein